MGCCGGIIDDPERYVTPRVRRYRGRRDRYRDDDTGGEDDQPVDGAKRRFESKGEKECREVLQDLYPGHKFINIRPEWLINPKTNRRLELDCYCEELMIAVEFNGKQHYEEVAIYSGDPNYQMEKDAVKVQKCKERGVLLIVVKYDVVDIREFILSQIRKSKKHSQPSVKRR